MLELAGLGSAFSYFCCGKHLQVTAAVHAAGSQPVTTNGAIQEILDWATLEVMIIVLQLATPVAVATLLTRRIQTSASGAVRVTGST